MTSIRIALVQPITAAPPEDEKNVAAAVDWIGRAANEGADFVVFPESYPGPWRMPASYEPHTRIAEAAAKHGIYAVTRGDRPDHGRAPFSYQPTVSQRVPSVDTPWIGG